MSRSGSRRSWCPTRARARRSSPIQACGVCHTDLHYREGGINDEFPFLLGHEAAGVVEAVGDGVTDVAPGDFVILNWRAVCGHCRACLRGEPWYCFATHNASQKMTLTDGTVLSPALGIGAFADKTLVAAGQCTKVDAAAPATVAGLLGCGVMAGLGAAINTGGVTRGQDAWPCSAAVASATPPSPGRSSPVPRRSIAVDIDDRKLAWAKEFGATHTCNSSTDDPVDFIRSVTGGFGADVCIEAIGNPTVYRQAFAARDLAGTVVLVGVPRPEDVLELPFIEVFGRGRGAEVELVRRLPAVTRLPDADRPVPPGPPRPRPASSARRSASTPSRRPSTRWSAARSSGRSWCSDRPVVRYRPDRADAERQNAVSRRAAGEGGGDEDLVRDLVLDEVGQLGGVAEQRLELGGGRLDAVGGVGEAHAARRPASRRSSGRSRCRRPRGRSASPGAGTPRRRRAPPGRAGRRRRSSGRSVTAATNSARLARSSSVSSSMPRAYAWCR